MSRKSMPVTGLVMGMLLLVCIVTVFMLIKGAWLSPDKEAVAVVEEFYQYEQEAEFASSWELFHSTMKKKFSSKGSYIQDRAHVFMNHFGVETFDFTVSEPEKIDQWKMSKTDPAMKNVYKILVTQTYKGKYGNFNLEQEVIAVKEKDEWKIVWDYNQ
jgi:hypothetical protein